MEHLNTHGAMGTGTAKSVEVGYEGDVKNAAIGFILVLYYKNGFWRCSSSCVVIEAAEIIQE